MLCNSVGEELSSAGSCICSIYEDVLWLLLLSLKGKSFLDQFLYEFLGSGHLPHAGSMRISAYISIPHTRGLDISWVTISILGSLLCFIFVSTGRVLFISIPK